ncbi:homeobox domain-containing protein [Rutstroemia sp. NJR-2017a BBW]|nr:homeobox domain-containing protein [Rutstroemia sp. NJR-2017a BBW]
MLVTRQCDTGRNTWSSSKLGSVYQNVASPRMSNFEALPPQPDWREQYSTYQVSGENGLLHQNYEQSTSSTLANNENQHRSQQQPSTRPPLEHRHTLGPIRQETEATPVIERPDSAPGDCGQPASNAIRNDSLVSTESTALSLGSIASNPLSSASNAPVQQGGLVSEDGDALLDPKEEDDDDEDDDEMLDAEDGASGTPQTAAERRAERRKMKRFRLTHQQTRFLMSEFAKQAHPDAAHRERLSREIPGLSPRQVQVWFQNRRAKIKRLTADDRERMMKMRAVPDDFDNVQALHSPYGAVHGIGTPMQSPVDFVPNYADHMIRPLMVDTMRRNEHDEHMSPTGLSSAFGHVGFNPGNSMGTPDALSPISINSSDRYFSSHLSSPMSSGPRSSNPFDRQAGYPNISQPRHHGGRPLQPLQLRETMSRSRSESLQSPLRSSMSWKGETLDYAHYQTGQPSPQSSGRQQSMYQPEQISNNSVNAQHFDTNSYPNSSMNQSPQHMNYSSAHSAHSQSSPSAMSRLRAASSAAFPSGLDLRTQYRTLSQQSPSHGHPPTSRASTFASAYSAGFASAPLTAPMDFSLPRTPGEANHPQLSAPMAPPQDFSNAYNSSVNGARIPQGERDFGAQSQNSMENGNHSHQPQRNNSDAAFHLRPASEFDIHHRRKRSFTMPGSYGPAHMPSS